MATPTDADLLKRAGRGDVEAFRRIYERHNRAIFRFCARLTGDTEEAADLMQETFLRAYRAADRFEPKARVTTWLYTIARNSCLNHLTRAAQRAAPPQAPGDAAPVEPDGLPSDGADPESATATRETVEAVRRAVGELPPSLRVPVILHRYHDLSYAEIAQCCGTTVAAVKLRLHRAKGMLRKALDPLRDGETPR